MPFPRPVSTLLALACLAFPAAFPAALPALELPIPTGGYDEEWVKSFDVDIKRGGGSHDDRLKAILAGSSVPANILHAGEQPTLTLQLQNLSDQVISGAAVVKLVRYELFTVPGQDMFHVAPRKLADAGETAITVQIPAKGFQDLEVKLRVPDTFGGYAILVQLAGRKPLLVGGMVRSLVPDAPRDPRFRRLAIDLEDPIAVSRLGAAPNRVGMSPISHDGEDASYESEYQRVAAIIKDLHAHQLPVTMEFGHGVPGTGKIHALGRGRHHLAQKTKAGETRPYGSLSAEESDGKAYETNDYSDLAWLPSFDPVAKMQPSSPQGPPKTRTKLRETNS